MSLLKLKPVYKQAIWGGEKLPSLFYQKESAAESWELSTHIAGTNSIVNGEYKGYTFREYINNIGMNSLGYNCKTDKKFPIIIKFIDAKKKLSIQLHPDDEYAIKYEEGCGKNEMWYIVDCKENAYIYCGFSKSLTKNEFIKHINNGTVEDVLNKIYVKKGDVIYIPAKTIHAIGEGIVACEIQQNSDSTYRVYDYDRKDMDGNLRPLHIKKALENLDMNIYNNAKKKVTILEKNKHYIVRKLVENNKFKCYKYDIQDESKIQVDDSSFLAVVFINGKGILSINNDEKLDFRAGDCFYVSAGNKILDIKGKGTCLIVRV